MDCKNILHHICGVTFLCFIARNQIFQSRLPCPKLPISLATSAFPLQNLGSLKCEYDMRLPIILTAIVSTAAIMAPALIAKSPKINAPMAAALSAPHRSEANRARDVYRHPAQTLAFFGVQPQSNVVELWPGGGWYTEILAPFLSAQGTYTVAPPMGKRAESLAVKLDKDPAIFGKVKRAHFPSAPGSTSVAPGSADVVLTFRNVHNWQFGGASTTQTAFNEMFAMLRPGGVLGVVEHRLPETMDSKLEEKSGYMKRSTVVAFATKAGFKLVGESQINANPKDTHAWPEGVWTLPPVYALKDQDRAKYAAIGESDRMTLKFVKPKK
jgi:predicted methyltransferase